MARHEAGGQGAKEVQHSVKIPAYTVLNGFILRSSDTNSQPTSAHVARAAGSRMPRLPLADMWTCVAAPTRLRSPAWLAEAVLNT